MLNQKETESNCPRLEVVFQLADQRLIVDIAPLNDFFKEYPYPPPQFADRIQAIMDNMVTSLPPSGSEFISELVRDYDMLRLLRDAFKQMKFKELPND